MAFALDADSEGAASASTLTVSHTIATGARLLVVSLNIRTQNNSASVSSMTHNGTEMTLVTAGKHVIDLSNTVYSGIYYRVDPPTGTNDVIVTLSGATVPRIAMNASSWFGDVPGDSTVLFDHEKDDGGDAFPTVTCPSEGGNLVIDACAVFRSDPTDTITVDGSQTQLANQTIGTGGLGLIGGTSYEIATSASTSMDWTINGATTNGWMLCVAAFREDAGRLLALLGVGL